MNRRDEDVPDGGGEGGEALSDVQPVRSPQGCRFTVAWGLLAALVIMSLLLWSAPASHGQLDAAFNAVLMLAFLAAPSAALLLIFISGAVSLLSGVDQRLRLAAATAAAFAIFADGGLIFFVIGALGEGMGG